jgi:predicted ABC-class ATPase
VVTRDDAVKVRSEDGRSIRGVNLSPFISDLPGGKDTTSFDTDDASGSTSLAAAIVESFEAESRLLLMDEDTCATNLLIRDARMQALVQRETITPLVDRIQGLWREAGTSTLLVLGGSGDYLDVADRVLLLEDYLPIDATERAQRVAAERPSERRVSSDLPPFRIPDRVAVRRSLDPRRGHKEKVRSRGLRELAFGEEIIDLSALEQLVDDSQARAIGVLLKEVAKRSASEGPIREEADQAMARAEREGLYALDPLPELAMPRRLELIAALNRLRSLLVRQA